MATASHQLGGREPEWCSGGRGVSPRRPQGTGECFSQLTLCADRPIFRYPLHHRFTAAAGKKTAADIPSAKREGGRVSSVQEEHTHTVSKATFRKLLRDVGKWSAYGIFRALPHVSQKFPQRCL